VGSSGGSGDGAVRGPDAASQGIAPRAEIGDPAGASHLDMGVRDSCVGWDMTTLCPWFGGPGAALRDTLAWRRTTLEARRTPAATARAEARE
jgi:hypothetical protein